MKRQGQRVREPLDVRWRRVLAPVKQAILLGRSLCLRSVAFSIPRQDGEQPLPALYVGEGASLPYYLQILRAQTPEPARRLWIPTAARAVAEATRDVPLVVIELNRWLASLMPPGGFKAPAWVRHVTDLEGEAYRHRRRGIERSYGQPVRRHAFRRTLSTSEDDLNVFFRDYHLAHLQRRHGAAACVRSLAQLRRGLRRGFLLQVWQGERWVSGLLVARTGRDRVQSVAAGLHPSRFESRRDGDLHAATYFLFDWAQENGVRTIDLGGTRSNRSDGVFRHKTLWAAEPVFDPWHHAVLVFYLRGCSGLPEPVREQLVWKDGRFTTIGEILNADAADGRESPQRQPRTTAAPTQVRERAPRLRVTQDRARP